MLTDVRAAARLAKTALRAFLDGIRLATDVDDSLMMLSSALTSDMELIRLLTLAESFSDSLTIL